MVVPSFEKTLARFGRMVSNSEKINTTEVIIMKLINLRWHFAAVALAASLTTGWIKVAYAQDPANTGHEGGDCPFADTEHGSCRDDGTTVTTAETEDEAAPVQSTDKLVICHRPGTPAQKTLFVASSAVPAHMDHGDAPGPCGD